MIVRPTGYKILQEYLKPYIINGNQLQKVLDEDLNDLVKGTLVYGYVRTIDSNLDLDKIYKNNIAWLAIDKYVYNCLPCITLKEYRSWINDEPKTSLKINI